MNDLWHYQSNRYAVYSENKQIAAQVRGWQRSRHLGTYTIHGRWLADSFTIPHTLLRRACRVLGLEPKLLPALMPSRHKIGTPGVGLMYSEVVQYPETLRNAL